MLTCDTAQSYSSSQGPYPTDHSLDLDCLLTDSFCLDLDTEVSDLASFWTPSLELSDTQNSSSSEPSPTTLDQAHMQSILPKSEHSNAYMSAKAHHYLPSQDSGLGIRTDETDFLSHYNPYCNDQSDLGHFDTEQHAVRSGRRGKLASPFDEQFYAAASGWPVSDGPLLVNTIAPTPYSSNPDHGFYQTPGGFGSVSYMTPQTTVNNTPTHFMSTPNGHFKRPMIRHNSTSSVIPQTTLGMDLQGTSSIEASPYQWPSQSETPLWHDAGHPDDIHMPTVMHDYVGFKHVDQSPQSAQAIPDPSMSMSTRKKPHLRPSLSESCVTKNGSPSRIRAMSMVQQLQPAPEHQYMGGVPMQQLPLPPLPPSVLVRPTHSQHQTPLFAATPSQLHRKPRSMSGTPIRNRKPSSPPPSDLNSSNTPFLAPVRQDPTFPGDLYTPRYKRRTSTGRWEGWCGYCHPGRWLDLKNSRFWEDKLRNHGICAKTKVRFAEPERIRWVTLDGKVCQGIGVDLAVGDHGTDQKKREGLCGVCREWVAMDGMRTKARDRAVGWWMHAYKVSNKQVTNLLWNEANSYSVTITSKDLNNKVQLADLLPPCALRSYCDLMGRGHLRAPYARGGDNASSTHSTWRRRY